MSAIYPFAKQEMLQGNIDMSTATIKVALVDTGTYTYATTHDYYNDISGVVGTPQTITPKTYADGEFDSSGTPTFTAVSATENTVEALVIYEDTGTTTNSHVIAYIDSGTGLPVTPSGGDITITWATTYIFAL